MIQIHILNALDDNYTYIIENKTLKKAIVIDVADGNIVNQFLEANQLKLEAVLLTHHHWDHVDGLKQLDILSTVVIGNTSDAHRLPKMDHEIKPGSVFEIADVRLETINADGHTNGQVAYYAPAIGALFSADSLMSWGCGKLYEGTPKQMHATFKRFANFPDETLVFSGHNYGEINGRFALSLDPSHGPSIERFEKIRQQNKSKSPIVPVSLAEEKQTNPYYRMYDDEYARLLGIKELSYDRRFAHIRKLRDHFK